MSKKEQNLESNTECPIGYAPVLPTVPYEYGIMSSRYRILAKNKLTAYAVMCLHYQNNSHMIAIYQPESCKKDSWMNPNGKISERLDEVFGGVDSFDKYLEDNITEIKECYATIEQLV